LAATFTDQTACALIAPISAEADAECVAMACVTALAVRDWASSFAVSARPWLAASAEMRPCTERVKVSRTAVSQIGLFIF